MMETHCNAVHFVVTLTVVILLFFMTSPSLNKVHLQLYIFADGSAANYCIKCLIPPMELIDHAVPWVGYPPILLIHIFSANLRKGHPRVKVQACLRKV